MNKDSPLDCYHCSLPVPDNTDYQAIIGGKARPMCCAGCKAVAEAIVSAGHEIFYQQRTEPAETGETLVPEFLRQTSAYDHPQIQKSFVHDFGDSVREASLILEGITCAACIWLNEQYIAQLPGVTEVQINYTTHRARVRWNDEQIKLSEILQAIHAIGYQAHPYDPGKQQQIFESLRKDSLLRIGVAGLFGMQVMMISLGLYVGDWMGIEPEFERFFRWLLAGLTLPVAFYAATPFYRSAWRDLLQRRIGMDVPVTLGISIAFGASLLATFTDQGHVYYDSVVMFTFFLLSSRYFELSARKQNSEAAEGLALAVPTMATRLGKNGEEFIPVAELQTGDQVLVRPGEQVPADGIITEGQSGIDESVLTGESLPVTRGTGDKLIGGSINTDSPLYLRVSEVGSNTVLAQILRLLDSAQAEKPRMASMAEKIASRFVSVILLLAVSVATYWWLAGSSRWLEITLSVLIVTCPCALSLATPTAISAATGTLQKMGMLIIHGNALETLARLSHFAFDKTGTLTRGQPSLTHTWTATGILPMETLQIAAALEQGSEHPLAKALIEAVDTMPEFQVDSIRNTPGAGIKGNVDQLAYRLGTPAFISENLVIPESALVQASTLGATPVVLANAEQVLAVFSLLDELRPDAKSMISDIHRANLQTRLLTGDHLLAAQRIADLAGLTDVAAELSPADKLQQVRKMQSAGQVVAMVGDGINDAPVLAAADLSIAMGSAAQISHANADVILLSNKLSVLSQGVKLARKTRRIMLQNMSWAIAYNLIALPAAAMGWLAPWMAALGMSLSSLIVVLNSMRLSRPPR